MSYIHSRYRRHRPKAKSALGDFSSTLTQMFGTATNAISGAISIADDPYLPEVVCRVAQLKAIQNSQTPGACTDTPLGLPGGVGIGNAILPLRGYVYAQQHKWVYPVALGVIVGLPLWFGFILGKADAR